LINKKSNTKKNNKVMTTTQAILWIIGGIGVILTCVYIYQMFTTKGRTKRSTHALLATGQMLAIPYATVNLLTKSGIQWKLIFVVVILAGVIAIFNLVSDTKEK